MRCIANCSKPIVSAIGHQIDHPLSDLAADAYAPTPSAAIERCIILLEDLENTNCRN